MISNKLSRGFGYFSVICVLSLFPLATSLADAVLTKQVYLVFDEDKLIASNIELNRFDEIRLVPKEEVLKHVVGKAIIAVVTNKRIMAYSVTIGSWMSRDTIANETVQSVEAEDYSAMVVTSKRFLGFNGKSGTWSESSRKKVFD